MTRQLGGVISNEAVPSLYRDVRTLDGSPAGGVFVHDREEINQTVAIAMRRHRHLRNDDVQAFLAADLAPLINAVAAQTTAAQTTGAQTAAAPMSPSIDPTRGLVSPSAHTIARAGLDVGLTMLAGRHLGPRALTTSGVQFFRMLPVLAPRLAEDSDSLLRDLAAAYIAIAREVNPSVWVTRLGELGPTASDGVELRRVAQVLAWTSGLPQFRHSAITTADQLPPELACACVRAEPSADWATIRDRLRADRWFAPFREENAGVHVATIGAFSGFGGVFDRPPVVATIKGALVAAVPGAVRSTVWHVLADAYGETAIATSQEIPTPSPDLPAGWRLDGTNLTVGGSRFDLGGRGVITSCARVGITCAITTSRSHRIEMLRVSEQPA
jgi:hypothetical protein